MQPVENLLARLEKVKGNPPKWRSLCPAHDNKRTLTLSIRELDDGRVLIHCHAGCGATDVLESLGMSLKDLHPGGALGHFIPGKRRKHREPEAEYGIVGARRLKQNLDEANRQIKRLKHLMTVPEIA